MKVAVVFVLLLLAPVTGAAQDLAPPVLVALDFNPRTVDVTDGDAATHVEMALTDDHSGVESVVIGFGGPDGIGSATGLIVLIGGDATSGDWAGDVTFSEYGPVGAWRIHSLVLADRTGRSTTLDAEDLETMGFPVEVTVVGDSDDDTPPDVTAFDFNPKTVDVTEDDAIIHVEMSLTDDLSGVQSALVGFTGPDGVGSTAGIVMLESGTINDGTWAGDLTFDQYCLPGNWQIEFIIVRDWAGRALNLDPAGLSARGYPDRVVVVGNGGDVDPPDLAAFDFDPKTVDISGGDASTHVVMTLTDDDAGIAAVLVAFVGPDGIGSATGVFSLESGDLNDGVWTGDATVSGYAQPGAWLVHSIIATDRAGRSLNCDTAGIGTLGFPTTLEVVGEIVPVEEVSWGGIKTLFR